MPSVIVICNEHSMPQVVSKHKNDDNLKNIVDHAIENLNSVLLLYIPDTANYLVGVGVGFYLG